jgi:hypothetical protein
LGSHRFFQVVDRYRCLQVYQAVLASLDASPEAHVLLHRTGGPLQEGGTKKALFFVPPSTQEHKGEENGLEILYCNASFARLASLVRACPSTLQGNHNLKWVWVEPELNKAGIANFCIFFALPHFCVLPQLFVG